MRAIHLSSRCARTKGDRLSFCWRPQRWRIPTSSTSWSSWILRGNVLRWGHTAVPPEIFFENQKKWIAVHYLFGFLFDFWVPFLVPKNGPIFHCKNCKCLRLLENETEKSDLFLVPKMGPKIYQKIKLFKKKLKFSVKNNNFLFGWLHFLPP